MLHAAIQLHTLRDLDDSLPRLITRVANAGFNGVEFAHRAREASYEELEDVAITLDETGVKPIGAHVGMADLESDPDAVMERYRILDCDTLIVPHISAKQFWSDQRVRRVASRLRDLDTRLRENGFELQYHNQHHEFMPFTGRIFRGAIDAGVPDAVAGKFTEVRNSVISEANRELSENTGFGKLLMETRDTGLRFEVDVGAVATAGLDPVPVLDTVGSRLGFLHVKDVTRRPFRLDNGQQCTNPGTGVVDLREIGAAARRNDVCWLVYENDHPEDPALALHRGRAAATAVGAERTENESSEPIKAGV